MPLCTCPPDALCPTCYGRELHAKRGQARTSGAVWAERERSGALTTEQAAALVAPLSPDPRLRAEFAAAAIAGAAAWWERRPVRYRDWSLVTVPDERERCTVVADGQRCERPTAYEVVGHGGELDDMAYVCVEHLELVRRVGDRV